MSQNPTRVQRREAGISDAAEIPAVADRATFQGELDALRIREKAHARQANAIAAARRRLPTVEIDPTIELSWHAHS